MLREHLMAIQSVKVIKLRKLIFRLFITFAIILDFGYGDYTKFMWCTNDFPFQTIFIEKYLVLFIYGYQVIA